MKRTIKIVVSLLLIGCGSADGDAYSAVPRSATTSSSTPTPLSSPVTELSTASTDAPVTTFLPSSTSLGPQSHITTTTAAGDLPIGHLEQIVADAARRTGAPSDSIDLVSVEFMEFNDSALGCPEPGQFYAQVITPGYQVIVEVDDMQLDYRVDERVGVFKLCEQAN